MADIVVERTKAAACNTGIPSAVHIAITLLALLLIQLPASELRKATEDSSNVWPPLPNEGPGGSTRHLALIWPVLAVGAI